MRLRTLFPLLLCFGLFLLASCATTAPPVKSADTYFKEGEEFYQHGAYEDAIAQWKKVKESYSSPTLSTLVELKIADAYFDSKSYIEAAAAYEDFRKLHPTHEKADHALYRLGLCYYKQISGIDTDQTPVKNAVTEFEAFLKLYPQSGYAAEVREKLAECKIKQAEYEIYVGRFYFRTDNYQAAIRRLEGELQVFPTAPVNDEALFYLGKAYILTGDKVKGRDAFSRLFKEYPLSQFMSKAKSFMEASY